MEKPVLSISFKKELAAENPFHVPVTMNDVEAWWDLTWLRYKTYRYKNHKRAIRRWWARARYEELLDARGRKQAIENVHLQDRQDRMVLRDRTEPSVERSAQLARVFGRKK